MAKGQEYSSYQRKVINRYYDNIDTITLTRLQELVSDLYLAEGKKAGVVTAKATAQKTVEALRKAGMVDDGAAQAVQVVLGLLSKGPPGGPRSLDMPITVQDRRLSLGRIELVRLKPVDWFRPPLR